MPWPLGPPRRGLHNFRPKICQNSTSRPNDGKRRPTPKRGILFTRRPCVMVLVSTNKQRQPLVNFGQTKDERKATLESESSFSPNPSSLTLAFLLHIIVPFFTRLTNGNDYEQAVLKFQAAEKCTIDVAQGNMGESESDIIFWMGSGCSTLRFDFFLSVLFAWLTRQTPTLRTPTTGPFNVCKKKKEDTRRCTADPWIPSK